MRFVADQHAVADVDAVLRQLVHFGEQRIRIDHDAVADDAGDAAMQDTGRDEAQDELGAVDVDGMAGVVPALIARHDRKMRGEKIDDLAFPFISPLRTKDSYIHMSR